MPGAFRILLIEDEPVIRELVRSMLSDDQVTVECAATGTEGLKLARTQPWDLILLDVVLPQLDGISICRLLKADASTKGIALHMLTAKARKADVDVALKAGADGYIHKPFRGSELMELVQRLRAAPRP